MLFCVNHNCLSVSLYPIFTKFCDDLTALGNEEMQTKSNSQIPLKRHLFMQRLFYSVIYSMVSVNSLLLTVTLYSPVRRKHFHNDTKCSVPLIACDCNQYILVLTNASIEASQRKGGNSHILSGRLTIQTFGFFSLSSQLMTSDALQIKYSHQRKQNPLSLLTFKVSF